MVFLMEKIDYILVILFAWGLIMGVVLRAWCHSHLRASHSVDFDRIEYSDNHSWILLFDYPLSECRRNSITHYLYRTCLRGSACRDCVWISRLVITVDVVWLVTGMTLLIRFGFAD